MREYKKYMLLLMVVLLMVPTNLVGPEEIKAKGNSCVGNWEMATDEDFSGAYDGGFVYIGDGGCVEIPHTIKGVKVTTYIKMFSDSWGAKTKNVKGVKSTNKNITDMWYMFENSQATSLDLSELDTSNVENMDEMFANSQVTHLDLSGFDTRNVKYMWSMFKNSQVTSLDLSWFDTRNVEDMDEMFVGVSVVEGLARKQVDADNFNNTRGKPEQLRFEPLYDEESCVGDWKMATDEDFRGTGNGEFIYIGDGGCVEIPHTIKGEDITSYYRMFSDNYGASTVNVKGVKSTNKNITNMRYMFFGSQATSLDLSYFDTSNVTNMSSMFYRSHATSLDLSHFDTSNVTDMSSMFRFSHATSLDLSELDTSNVKDMSSMFYGSHATSLDLSHFDTSNVKDMSTMFVYSKITSMDLSHFDTSNVTNMSTMFGGSETTSLDLSRFDTSNVTDMSSMFRDSQVTKLDLSSFDTSKVTNVVNMFSNAAATEGVARTKRDAEIFNYSSDKPDHLWFNPTTPDITLSTNGTEGYRKDIHTEINTGLDKKDLIEIKYQITNKKVFPTGGDWKEVNNGDTVEIKDVNGEYYIHAIAKSVYNKEQKFTSNVFKLDSTPPTVTISKNGGNWEKSHTAQVNVSDAHSGINKIEYRWTTGTSFPTSGFTTIANGATVNTPTTTGNHYLHVKATDNVGNVRQYTSSVYRVDRTAPTLPSISGSTSWMNSNQSITITTGTDSHSGVSRTEYRIDNGTWTEYRSAISVTKEGSTKIDARTIDKVGNVSSVVTKTIKIDKTKPTLTITPNVTGITHEDVILTVKSTDTLSGVKEITKPDGEVVKGDTTTYKVKENGEYVFEVEDAVGNKEVKTITVANIDKTLNFKGPEIEKVADVKVGQEEVYSIEGMQVKDWRDLSNQWSIGVKGEQLRHTDGSKLSKGTMKIGKVTIRQLKGEGNLPDVVIKEETVVDGGNVVELVRGKGSRGEYWLDFEDKAVTIKANPKEAKTGVYEGTLTWLLYDTPTGN